MRGSYCASLGNTPGRIQSLKWDKEREKVVCTFIDRTTWTPTPVFLEQVTLPKKSKKKVEEVIKTLKPKKIKKPNPVMELV